MDVGDWLRGCGLERYEQAFRDNEIDVDLLPNLTGDDLKEIGVSLVGHRRRLLDAIARLRAATPGSEAATAERAIEPAAIPEPGADQGGRPPLRAEAERRQLTVMFVDLVGSTALSARLDPEDMGRVMRAYQECCAEIVERWGGHVAKYMGDGVLAYFGWPRAHEDQAERAVRAGLTLTEAVGKLATPAVESLAARVGIATGLVMVGELIGEGSAREQTVVGETPNLAARLQALAAPGSVVISQATRRLVGGLFELADLGECAIRGFGTKVPAWQVRGGSRAESRFQARSATGRTPFVGRQHELGLLLDRFDQASEGEGQVVLLSGEPGIGKSRLVHALIERLADAPHTRLRYYCSPYHVNSALYPVIEQLVRSAGFKADDPPERRLDQLEAVLSKGTSDPAAVTPLFAALLGIPAWTRYPALNLPAQRQRELTIGAIVDQVSGLAARQPVVMVLEDGQWLNPTTTELFERIIERVQTLPVLLLITFRPEFTPPWISYPHMTALTLNRLGRRYSVEMIAAVAGGKPLPGEVLAQIWAKTEGVPLFVEELTKTVLESGLLEAREDRYELVGPLPPLAIPTTLQDSLMARLDRLAPVKEVAQIGAVIGREFSYRLLSALSPLEERALQDALSHLVGSELVFRRGTIPNATYSFKHAFVQDAAYASLLKSKRQQLHGAVAAALGEHFPEVADSQPEILAHHCTEAGLANDAADYWCKAGQQAITRSAMAEAAMQLTNGLEVLRNVADGPERQRRELELQAVLGQALSALKGYAAPETGRAYARARALCEATGEGPHLFPCCSGSGCFISCGGSWRRRARSARSYCLAERQRDRTAQLVGHRAVASVLSNTGELILARGHLERLLALYDPVEHRSLALLYGQDPGVVGRCWLARCVFALGHPDQAMALAHQADIEALELGHPYTTAVAHYYQCELCQFSGDRRGVLEHAETLIGLGTKHDFPFWLALGTVLQGWVRSDGADAAAAIAQIRDGLTAYWATGGGHRSPYLFALLAEAHARAGDIDAALGVLTDALARAEETGERWFEAELHRLRGETVAQRPGRDRGDAEVCLHRALAVARAQSARTWELRAATSLARLWRDQGRRAAARDLLAPVYGWFTEGFDTADLKDARALLDELR